MATVGGISPRVLDTLQRLGLTEYGARCYAALVGMESAEAAAISDASEVPRTKVYGILKDLVDSGWVIAEGGRPARYHAAPPDERVARAQKEIDESATAAVQELMARRALASQMVPMSVYLLRGAPVLAAKSVELVDRARRECLIVLGFLLPDEAKPLAEAALRARRRGVQVRLLVPATPLMGPLAGLDAFADLLGDARASPFPFRAVISDLRQALVMMPQPDVDASALTGLWNPTEHFVQAVAPVLRAAWETAPAHRAGP